MVPWQIFLALIKDQRIIEIDFVIHAENTHQRLWKATKAYTSYSDFKLRCVFFAPPGTLS